MIFIIRANHANEFELQNYLGIKNLKVITSLHPLTQVIIPSKQLWSPTELPNFPYHRQIFNRLFGGSQWLIGLEKYLIDQRRNIKTSDKLIVHTAETYTPYTHQAVLLKKEGLIDKLVCTCWETIPHNNEKFARLRSWKKEAYQYVDIFHTPTERAKQALVAEGVYPGKISIIPYGVDLQRFRPTNLPGISRKVKVLTVARLEIEKGMLDLEKVAARLPNYDFVVVGNGSYHPKGRNIIIKQVSYDEIHKEYQSADVFFLPSRPTSNWEEQYGMVLVEAMASKLPILSTESGSIPEIVGSAGILNKPGDTESAVRNLQKLGSNKILAEKVARSGYRLAQQRYDSRKVGKLLSSLYR